MNYDLKAEKLNDLQRADILYHLENISGHKSYKPSTDSIKILFDYFNKYINSTPSDMWCGDCRRTVVDFWKKQQSIWI